MYRPLTEETVVEQAHHWPEVKTYFGDTTSLRCKDLADGNVNLVFRLSSACDDVASSQAERSIIVKQALPHARRYPDFKMPLDRARIERETLLVYQRVSPGVAPRPLGFDQSLYVNLMEDLSDHRIMRECITRQIQAPDFASVIGGFMARTLFYTSDYAMSSAEKKSAVAVFMNPVLCKVTEDLVFTFPFLNHPTNRAPNELAPLIAELRSNDVLQRNVAHARYRFLTAAEALVHGDLHTGSIMVSGTETRVIDPEFAFYGPIAFDPGMLLANLAIGSFAQRYHAAAAPARRGYQAWLANTAERTLATFKRDFTACWQADARPEWRIPGLCEQVVTAVEHDMLLYCGCEMIRRTIGMAHVSELDEISDPAALVDISAAIVQSGAKALTNKFGSCEEFVASWDR